MGNEEIENKGNGWESGERKLVLMKIKIDVQRGDEAASLF
jgi:hypothetical protein